MDVIGVYPDEYSDLYPPTLDDLLDILEPGDVVAVGRWALEGVVIEINEKYEEIKVEYALTELHTGDPLIFRGWFDVGNVTLILKATAA